MLSREGNYDTYIDQFSVILDTGRTHSWALLYRDTFMPIIFVKVSEKISRTGALLSCFLWIITV